MPTRVLVLGLDAVDTTLLRAGADDGTLPTFARLYADAPELKLENGLSTLPGAIWPEIATGRSFWTLASDASARVAVVGISPPAGLDGRSLLRRTAVA